MLVLPSPPWASPVFSLRAAHSLGSRALPLNMPGGARGEGNLGWGASRRWRSPRPNTRCLKMTVDP